MILFQWVSEDGPINYHTHGDGSCQSISYEKGRGVPEDEGELVAAVIGTHDWFFRNPITTISRWYFVKLIMSPAEGTIISPGCTQP